MQSHVEINVSLNGRHFFATAPRSGTDRAHVKDVLASIRHRFPESEGFQVTATYWEGTGRTFDEGDGK
jgi:alpha-mannosidase